MEKYVLITGASSGLGADFARRYAQEGRNLILTARRYDRLVDLKLEIQSKSAVDIRIIQADLTLLEDRNRLIEETLSEVDLLINNAGFGIGGEFEATSYTRVQRMIDVNISALTHLSHAFLTQMKQQRHGTIINIASMAGFIAGPYMAAYYASKAYVLSLSEALHEEALPFGVKVIAVCPGPTLTEFFDHTGENRALAQNVFLMQSKDVVDMAMRDAKRNKAIAISGKRNRFLRWLISLFGRRIARKSVAKIQGSRQ